MRNTQFANGEYYHIYNRGVDKRTIFENESDYFRFYISLILLNSEQDGLMDDWRDFRKWHPRAQLSEFLKKFPQMDKMVNIVAYCLNPNHFHLLLRQETEEGVKKYMHKIGTSYTNYFNAKCDRSGSLFQGRFKSSHIKTNEKLLYMSVYVGANSEIHAISPARSYRWCSYPEYMSTEGKSKLCEGKNIVLNKFRNSEDCKSFFRENITHMKEKKEDERIILE